MNKHSQEPWQLIEEDENHFKIVSKHPSRAVKRWRESNPEQAQKSFNEVNICRLSATINGSGEQHGPKRLIDSEEVRANAELLVMAPKLLYICKTMLQAAKEPCGLQRDNVITLRAKDIIKKVEEK